MVIDLQFAGKGNKLFAPNSLTTKTRQNKTRKVFSLGMEKTDERNATLVYVAVDDKQAAILGDAGIHQRVGQEYWEAEIKKMLLYFKGQQLTEGLCQVIGDIGEALHHYFPYSSEHDKNELPDDIVFGR